MTDLLLTAGVSNLCLSVALALVAWAVQRSGRRPLLAHLLWVLVLVKLVTPPVLTVPVIPVPGLTASRPEAPALPLVPAGELAAADRPGLGAGAPAIDEPRASAWIERARSGLVLAWLLGSAGVLAWSLLRILRFNRLLGMASRPAPPALQRLGSELARRLGLKAVPAIRTTTAHLSPMVWWTGGRVRVLVPASLPDEMDGDELRWILAHELAHVRRRDHLVRWLEWLACVCFWWNPVAWWARLSLRATEELCCDALVLSSLKPDPHAYASSLLNAVELIAFPALRPPAMASEMNSGGILERRLRMITSNSPFLTTPRWLQASILLCAVGLLPLGVAHAQERGSTQGDRGDQDRVRERVAALMTRCDADEDGAITEAEAGKVWARISTADADEDGKVTGLELYKAWGGEVRDGGEQDPIRVRVAGVMKRFDKDGDGAITKAEAGDFWARVSSTDANEDGKVTAMEMYVAWGGKPGGDDDDLKKLVDGLLERFDRDKDGAITEAEAGERWPRISTADANKDGKVTEREMHAAWGDDDLKKLVDGLLERFDRDKDGAITEAEAGERWPRISTADADKDGKVTAREMLGSWR